MKRKEKKTSGAEGLRKYGRSKVHLQCLQEMNMHCYERSSFSCLPCSSSGCITKHLMFELWRNSYFCFPSGLNVSLDFFSGILRPLAKENQLFPSGADFKRITVVNMKVILSVMYTT